MASNRKKPCCQRARKSTPRELAFWRDGWGQGYHEGMRLGRNREALRLARKAKQHLLYDFAERIRAEVAARRKGREGRKG